jgi:hypothetical protein
MESVNPGNPNDLSLYSIAPQKENGWLRIVWDGTTMSMENRDGKHITPPME